MKLEISYYLKALAEVAPEEILLAHIRSTRLMETLQAFARINSQNPKYDQEIALNATQTQELIARRVSRSNPEDGQE